MKIITEMPHHRPAILEINHLAFNGDDEGQLIEALGRDRDIIASLVAIDVNDEVVGHILFSQLRVIVEGREVIAAALAPMAVTPNRQNQGIGSQLVKHGIDTMKSAEQAAIIVLGHKQFYPRFGFRHDLAQNLSCPFNQYDEFMGLELVEGSLAGKVGTCRYPEAFAAV